MVIIIYQPEVFKKTLRVKTLFQILYLKYRQKFKIDTDKFKTKYLLSILLLFFFKTKLKIAYKTNERSAIFR